MGKGGAGGTFLSGTGRKDGSPSGTQPSIWPKWARILVSIGLAIHMLAVVAGAISGPPSSPLEQLLAKPFAHYYELFDQGYTYRFYAPEPPPTPILIAELHFRDGRPTKTIRLPDRDVRPRLRYQRQMALAYHLFEEYASLKASGGGSGHWAPSYARHLGKVHGCSSVTFFLVQHVIPPLDRMTLGRQDGRAHPPGIDDEEFYSVPERIGEFPCDAS
jgi:hypothetical protein